MPHVIEPIVLEPSWHALSTNGIECVKCGKRRPAGERVACAECGSIEWRATK